MTPMSYAQRQLWFQWRVEGPSATFNSPTVLRLTGDLDTAALEQALRDVIDRHETLRTVFPEVTGKPQQRVLSPHEIRWELAVVRVVGTDARGDRLTTLDELAWDRDVIDLPAPTPAEEEPAGELAVENLPSAVARVAAHPFDLSAEIPIRAWLFAVGRDHHVLVVVIHHIATDGWSGEPFARDLAAAYRARRNGGEPGWPALPVRYSDYASWQRELLGAEDDPASLVSRQIAYWRQVLAGAPAELDLPVRQPRSGHPRHGGHSKGMSLPAETHVALTELGRRHRVTVPMILQTAVAILLSRFGAGTDISLGTPLAGRTDPALNDLVGFFVNTLIVRVDLSGDPTVADVLGRVRRGVAGALANQDVPFDKLVERLAPPRVPGCHPLFQVMVAPLDTGVAIDLDGVRGEPLALGRSGAKFDVEVMAGEVRAQDGTPAGIRGVFTLSADLFDEATAARLADGLVQVLGVMVEDPGRRVSGVGVLSGVESGRLLVGWNDTFVDAGGGGVSVGGLFEGVVGGLSGRVAVIGGGVSWSFGELGVRVDRLAAVLVGLGVGVEVPVVVVMERSVELVVALLGVVRAGGVVVPVDGSWPLGRVKAVVADCAAWVAVADRPVEGLVVVSVDGTVDGTVVGGVVEGVGLPVVPGEASVYRMYTSGSSGRAKGVVTTHRNVIDLVRDRCWGLGPSARVLFHAPYAFDASSYEVWVALLSGAAVVVAPPGPVDAAVLRELIAVHGVTHVHVTAGLLRVLAEQDPGCFAGVVEVLTGGDVVPAAAVARVLAANAGVRVRQLYGPTEVTLCATQQLIDGPLAAGPVLPIGRPLDNTRVYVLDDRLTPVPVGVVGELYVAGAGLARGYAGQPALTAARFTADPYHPTGGGRWYRTGDLARWTEQGTLVFAGRADDQIKIRGYRVEPGEVETVLATCPGVHHAAVIVRTHPHDGSKHLAAYLTLHPDTTLDHVRHHTQHHLPDYLHPTTYSQLDTLPLTTNHKIDRAALAAIAPERETTPTAAPAAGPIGALEDSMCQAFAETLGLDRVGVDDDFFTLGGHSLLAVALVQRLKARGVVVTVQDIMAAPTVSALVGSLSRSSIRDSLGALLPIRRTGDAPPLFCVHPAGGLSWCYMPLARHVPADRPIYGLQARGTDGAEPLAASLRDMAADYAAQMRSVQPDGPYHVLGFSFGGLPAHEIAVQLRDQGADVTLIFMDSYPMEEPDSAGPADEEELPWEELISAEFGRVLGGFSENELAVFAAVFRNNTKIRARHALGRFDGDALLIASIGSAPNGESVTWRWKPHITGEITQTVIPCEHTDLVRPDMLGLVWQAVEEWQSGRS